MLERVIDYSIPIDPCLFTTILGEHLKQVKITSLQRKTIIVIIDIYLTKVNNISVSEAIVSWISCNIKLCIH